MTCNVILFRLFLWKNENKFLTRSPQRNIDLLTCGILSTRIAMVDNAPLFKVFDEESNIMQRLSELFYEEFFFLIYFRDK